MASLSHPARGAASAEETPQGAQAHEVGEVASDLVQNISRLPHQCRGLPR